MAEMSAFLTMSRKPWRRTSPIMRWSTPLNAPGIPKSVDELNAVLWGCQKADPEAARRLLGGVSHDYDGYLAGSETVMEAFKSYLTPDSLSSLSGPSPVGKCWSLCLAIAAAFRSSHRLKTSVGSPNIPSFDHSFRTAWAFSLCPSTGTARYR